MNKFYGDWRKYEARMIKYEWVKIFNEEHNRKRWWTNGMNIPFKTCGLDFLIKIVRMEWVKEWKS